MFWVESRDVGASQSLSSLWFNVSSAQQSAISNCCALNDDYVHRNMQDLLKRSTKLKQTQNTPISKLYKFCVVYVALLSPESRMIDIYFLEFMTWWSVKLEWKSNRLVAIYRSKDILLAFHHYKGDTFSFCLSLDY